MWSDIPVVELPEDMTEFEELFARKKKTVGGPSGSVAQSMLTRAPKVTSHSPSPTLTDVLYVIAGCYSAR